ncbi:hypothetical protein [Porphyromonas somerae]|uniref:hypothetical protein n=1 Tax=Porphyromonas somerae TaxID=322095 RepID=UPI001FCA84FD|nr:hypothetical protein [Porphyromonas somerae]BDE81950.1 hypothetical protein CE91St14_09780 [Porphyromonas somerae]
MGRKQRNKGRRGNDNFFYDLRTGSNPAIYDKLNNGVRVIINYCHSEKANPRTKSDGFWKFSFLTSLFNLGDEEYVVDTTDIGSWKEYECVLRQKFNAVKLVPVYMTGDMGKILSTKRAASFWDSSQLGYAFLTEEDVVKLVDTYSARRFHEVCKFFLNSDLIRYECYLNGDAYSLLVDDLRGEKNLLYKEGYLGCDFIINGIVDDLPPQFVEDVFESIPEFFAISLMDEDLFDEEQPFGFSDFSDPLRVGGMGVKSNHKNM